MSDRRPHAPVEMAAHQAALDAAQQVHADLGQDLHHREVLAAYEGRPTPAEAVARGVTPSSGGA